MAMKRVKTALSPERHHAVAPRDSRRSSACYRGASPDSRMPHSATTLFYAPRHGRRSHYFRALWYARRTAAAAACFCYDAR